MDQWRDFLSEIKASLLSLRLMLALVIDEFQDLPRSFHAALRDDGYVLEAARSRGEALWLLDGTEFDVVICYAPHLNVGAPRLVQEVRQRTQAPLLVTGKRGEMTDRITVLDAGADDVLMTSVLHEGPARLRALARRPAALRPQQVVQGSLCMDITARCVYREGLEDPIDLTAREFAVLELMMRHPKVVLSRSRLVEHVWGASAFVQSNVVDQLVSRLRAKLSNLETNEIITVRGLGYRFEPIVHNVVRIAS